MTAHTLRTLKRWMAAACAALVMLATSGIARADDAPLAGLQTAGAASDWTRIKLSGGGRRPSLALDPTSGQPYVSFYQAALDEFWLARHTENPAKSCGGNPGWECKMVNDSPTAGYHTSLAFVPGKNEFGVAWSRPQSTFYYISRFDLNLNWLGTDHAQGLANPGPNWYIRPMDLMYIGDKFIEAVEQAYEGSIDGPQKYFRMRRHDQPYATYWQPDVVEGRLTYNSHGRYASIDWSVGNDGGQPDDKIERVAYRDSSGGLRFAYARFDGNGSGCTNPWDETVEEWSCEQVDPAADVYWTDLRASKCSGAGCVDPYRIYYYDENSGKLKLAQRTGNAAHNCNGGAAGWSCGVIDSIAVGKSTTGIRISMAAIGGGIGQVKVAYTDKDDAAHSVLKIATLTGNANDTCAPGGLPGWKCEVVDDGGGAENTGWDPSLGWDGDNLYIAYWNQTQDNLMIAYPKRAGLPVAFNKTYSPGTFLRGSEFNVTYTIQNGSDRMLSGLTIKDYTQLWHEFVSVLANTCDFTVDYTSFNLMDVLDGEKGKLAPNTTCALTVRMRAGNGAPRGAGADLPGALALNEGYDLQPTGASAYTILTPSAFVPVTQRQAEADW